MKPDGSPSLDVSTLRPLASTAPRFHQVLTPKPTPTSTLLGLSSPRFKKLPVGSRIEVSPASFKIARQIGELLHDATTDGSRSAGSALIVDYGGNKVYGNSFRVRPRSLLVIASIHPRPPSSVLRIPFLAPENSYPRPVKNTPDSGADAFRRDVSTGLQEPPDRGRLPPAWRVRPHGQRRLQLSRRSRSRFGCVFVSRVSWVASAGVI